MLMQQYECEHNSILMQQNHVQAGPSMVKATMNSTSQIYAVQLHNYAVSGSAGYVPEWYND